MKICPIVSPWSLFSRVEQRNLLFYILGLMFYKFGLEAFNGSILTLATNRYDQDAFNREESSRTFERVGLLTALNQACQCLGSILIAPLIKRYSTRLVLSSSIFIFGLFTSILLLMDLFTGGSLRPRHFHAEHSNDFRYYGKYPTDVILFISSLTGVTYGMVELIRRVIPRDLVGGDLEKLQRMDSLVHIFYEISGTLGALTTALLFIPQLGNNYAFLVTPICFTLSSAIWFCLGLIPFEEEERIPSTRRSYCRSLIEGFSLFFESISLGAKIVFTRRKFVWLWFGYSLSLYAHRYLENGIAPQIARRYLQKSEWSQIIVGGSNFGELLGALFVYLFSKSIFTPIPWLRLDALLLLIVWYIPFFYPPAGQVKYAWFIALTFIPISFGWAAGDVSLVAFIQSSLTELETKHRHVSALGAVMAFLYSSYIILYAIANPLLGKYIDRVYHLKGTIRPALLNTLPIQFTVILVIVFLATFIPKGSFHWNPTLEEDEPKENNISTEKTSVTQF